MESFRIVEAAHQALVGHAAYFYAIRYVFDVICHVMWVYSTPHLPATGEILLFCFMPQSGE